MMGSSGSESFEAEKQHKVTLTTPYYIQTTEVTQGQWKRVMGSNPSRFNECGYDCPVENVSYIKRVTSSWEYPKEYFYNHI